MKMMPCPKCRGHGSIPDPVALGESIRQLRRRSGLTLEQVKERTGLNLSLLSHLENGKETWTWERIDKLKKVCREELKKLTT